MRPDFRLDQRDALEWLADQPDESVDLMITDPPYESLEKHRRVGTTTRLKQSKASSNHWFRIFPNARFDDFFREAWRVLTRNAHLYLFCDAETMFVVKPLAEGAGFRFWKPIIWDKVKIGMGYHYRARCERILFFEKGKRRLHNLGVPDVLAVPRVHRGYPTEKPVELMKILVSQSSNEGELVADPFMGSGPVAVAALSAGRRFGGNDLAAEAVELTRSRIAGIKGMDSSLPGSPTSAIVAAVPCNEAPVGPGAGPVTTPPHRGRIQAQGKDIPDHSRAWADAEVPTKLAGLQMTDALEGELPRQPRKRRAKPFAQLRRAVRLAPPEGFSGPYLQKYPVDSPPKKARGARVDLEVWTGQAFRDDP